MNFTYGRSNIERKSYGHEVLRCEVKICCEYPGTTGTTGEPGKSGTTGSSQVSMQVSTQGIRQVSTQFINAGLLPLLCYFISSAPCLAGLETSPKPNCWRGDEK